MHHKYCGDASYSKRLLAFIRKENNNSKYISRTSLSATEAMFPSDLMISTSVLIPTRMEVDFHSQKKEKLSAETLPAVIVMPPSVIVALAAPALVAQGDV